MFPNVVVSLFVVVQSLASFCQICSESLSHGCHVFVHNSIVDERRGICELVFVHLHRPPYKAMGSKHRR